MAFNSENEDKILIIDSDKLSLKDYLDFFARISLFLFTFIFFIFLAYFFLSHFISGKLLTSQKNILYVAPYHLTILQGMGVTTEPKLKLAVKTKNGYQKISFLLDSGAVISSLPREMATAMGYNLAFLPRTTFIGYGNKLSFAYRGSMIVKLGRKEVSVPVVFTQAAATQPLLGRKGVFDRFGIIFDAQNKQIIIKDNG